jgi:hypothetical protein
LCVFDSRAPAPSTGIDGETGIDGITSWLSLKSCS